jgi:hypothetical protein
MGTARHQGWVWTARARAQTWRCRRARPRAPMGFLTILPTRPRGEPVSESEAPRSAALLGRGVVGPTASISR